MQEEETYSPRPIQLPAVLQIAGQAPYFGTIASMTSQGLSFDFQNPVPPDLIGNTVRLDFDLQDQHHTCRSLCFHAQGHRAMLSIGDASPAVIAALHSVTRHNTTHLAATLATLQKQQACHARFMDGMLDVVSAFFRLLNQPAEPEQLPTAIRLQQALNPMHERIEAQFTRIYPMYMERKPLASSCTSDPDNPVDMANVDDWIRRTSIAQRVSEFLSPLPQEFDHHYTALMHKGHRRIAHPYHADEVLHVLSCLIGPLQLSEEEQTRCHEWMAEALQSHAGPTYQAMLEIIGEAAPETLLTPEDASNLSKWLRESVHHPENGQPAGLVSAEAVSDLTALLVKLTDNLDAIGEPGLAWTVPPPAAGTPIPELLARDRIVDRFAPQAPAGSSAADPLQIGFEWAVPPAAPVQGGLTDLDEAALASLRAELHQPPPVDPGPERLAPSSQVRALMLQAQGLILEYTLNGLTYQSQPNHPAWRLMNALEALHRGADDRGQFLDPALYKASSLAMQWLLEQDNTDTALAQVNAMLARINEQFLTEQQSRRQQYLSTLGHVEPLRAPLHSDWCVVRRDEEAIPYEVLGEVDNKCALLNRSATRLLEIPAERFAQEVDGGLIEEAGSYDQPFLQRTASVSLASSLAAVHAYTWQDPASGCLKRAALMDELERRLAAPVIEPPSFCALIEIPTMRPVLSSLPGEQLLVMQSRTGELLQDALEPGEHCGRLSDVSFMMVFAPQAPERVADRLTRLKTAMEALHPEWKMIGAAVPLIDESDPAVPSSVLRRANQACGNVRAEAGFDLSCLSNVPPVSNQIEPLPFDSLYLRCQKIAACDAEGKPHYEILLGVSDTLVPSHTTQSFVIMAEQTGRIHELDAWLMRSVLEWMDGQAAGLEAMSGLSVNLSGNSLTDPDHIGTILSLLGRYPHLTGKLIFEVTETAAIGNLDVAVTSLRALRNMGCRVALDDFGSGYSSYGYLRNLPLDYLKIDGTYIRQILTDKTDQALTASMVDVAHALGLKVIAEYVDTEATYAWLKELGVDYVQGYWVHEPERLDTLALALA